VKRNQWVKSKSVVMPALAIVAALASSFTLAATPDDKLMQALRVGDITKAGLALDAGAKPNQLRADGSLPLAWAAEAQNLALVKLLLAKGAKPDADALQNKSQNLSQSFSPLVVACQRGDPAIVAALLDAGAEVNRPTATGISPLALCAGHSTAAAVKRLLELGAEVEAADETGQTPLMWAAANGQVEAINLLIAQGAKVNRLSKAGFSPLFFALKSPNPQAPLAMLAAGGDASYRTPDGTSAVQMAIYQHQFDVAAVLFKRGAGLSDADLTAFDRNGNQLLHAAILNRQPALVDLLLAQGANPNALTGTSNVVWRYEVNFTSRPYVAYPKSPLFLAVERGAPEIMKILVAAGADTKFRIEDGTNLVLAAAVTDPATLEQAFRLAPDMNVTNKRGQTPLLSLMNGASYLPITNPQLHELFKVLSNHGARIDIADTKGQTPKDLAQTEEFRAKTEFADVFL